MKVVNPDNPVTSGWLAEQGVRLTPALYLSGALEARKILERLPNTVPLKAVTAGFNGGIFNGPKFSRVYLDSLDLAVPFLGSSDMMEADLSFLPKLSMKVAEKFPYLQLVPGMTLISCSGTVGRMTYVRPDMGGIWSSQHVMKVVADVDRIPSGYLYSFLRSRYGVSMVASSAYGAIIQHIEPHHIADLPVPRFEGSLEGKIHSLVEESARLRSGFQVGLNKATEDFFKSVGLPELSDFRWRGEERDLGFEVYNPEATSLRALNFSPRARRIMDRLGSVQHRTLGGICVNGQLGSGVRFKRVDASPEHGVRLVGQRQGFWQRPEGRWISPAEAPAGIFAQDETVLIAAQGTLGENEVFCRAAFVTGSWLNHAYTQHFLRVVSGSSEIPGSYLFAFLRSEAAFRLLRSMSVGGKQQDIHEALRARIPIPIAAPADRERIAETVRQAYRDRDRADVLEDEAIALLTTAIEEAAA
ncbi:restriction endonuclease subunit S [Nocardiopsis sp. FR26]|uniref:methylation-associated defense system restriction endonuclease subunit S MAD5 n=1 Tax=Nocardiopsis sp. FR26 TaxID=2605987 RepID=UPI001356C4A5|nr:restriction endonuclease subunit S [Nocardiopsis sp. FR26]